MVCSPTGARGATLTTSAGAAWINTAWVELISAANAPAVAWAIEGLHIEELPDIVEVEYDIGFGAAGSETVASTLRLGGNTNSTSGVLLLPLLLSAPASTRVSIRTRNRAEIGGATSVVTSYAKLLYYLAAPAGVTATAAPLKAAPPAARMTITLSASTWTNGAWSEVTASTSEIWSLAAVNVTEAGITFDNNGDEIEIDVGVGAAGSEAVVTTVRVHTRQSCDVSLGVVLDPVLIGAIGSGVRVAVRARHRRATAVTFNVALAYYGGAL